MKKYLATFSILTLLSFALVVPISLSAQRTGTEKPNVILILTDDQGDGDLECHGNPHLKTPALNALYHQSVRFTDFHVDPSCSPTRSALLTGSYSMRAGVWHTIGGRSLLREGMPTVADLFSDNGYETAVFGKWHLGENYPFRPMDRGFKESVVFGGGTIGSNADRWANSYVDGTFLHNGKYQNYPGYCNTVWFQEALSYIEKNKDKPFFVYLPTNVPHAPLEVDKKYSDLYKGTVSDRLAGYYGMISKLDEDMGHFLSGLKRLGLDSNTILMFMSDNGPCPWFGGIEIDWETGSTTAGYSGGLRGGKIWGYENAHKVPFFMRWPQGGIGGGKNIPALSTHMDILPTLIDLCGLTGPPTLKFDGRSLAPLLQNRIREWPDDRTVFVHNQRVEYPVKDKEYQVLTEKWRLVKREKDELYNIQDDAGQSRDLAAQYPEVVRDLYRRYEQWWKDVYPRTDEYAAIHIGSPYEERVTLFPHDAHKREGKSIWVVRVDQEGRYRIKLNRWPEESGKKIVENIKGDKQVSIQSGHLKIGNLTDKKDVTTDLSSIYFDVDLSKGITCLELYFKADDINKIIGSGWAYVERIDAADQRNLKTYIPSVPDKVLRDRFEEKIEPYN
jgi:arylsulfatase A-like enzyme